MLAHGWNFFGCSWPDITDRRLEDRDNWPGQAALAEMREAWAIHREALLAEFADGRPLWAESVFELGENPREVLMRDCRKYMGFGNRGKSKQPTSTNNTPQE